MDNCLTVLQLYAGLTNLEPSITEQVNRHLEKCETCADTAFSIAQHILFPAHDDSALSEETAVKLLKLSPSKMEPSDHKAVSLLFSTGSGRTFIDNIAQFEYASEPLSEEMIAAVSNRLKAYVDSYGKKVYVPEFVIRLTKAIGKAIDNLQEVTGELISVIQAPLLTPALASLRSPLYDDVLLQENSAKIELPFYFDPDTVLRMSFSIQEGKISGLAHFSREEEELTIRSVSINGCNYSGSNFEIEVTSYLDIEVDIESDTEYRAGINIDM